MRSVSSQNRIVRIANDTLTGTLSTVNPSLVDFLFDTTAPTETINTQTDSIDFHNVVAWSFKAWQPEQTCVKFVNLSAFVPVTGATYTMRISNKFHFWENHTVEERYNTIRVAVTATAGMTGTQLAIALAKELASTVATLPNPVFKGMYNIISTAPVAGVTTVTAPVNNTSPADVVTARNLNNGYLQIEAKLIIPPNFNGYPNMGWDFDMAIADTSDPYNAVVIGAYSDPTVANDQRVYSTGNGTFGIASEAESAINPRQLTLVNVTTPHRKAQLTTGAPYVGGTMQYNTIFFYENRPLNNYLNHINVPQYNQVVHEWYVSDAIADFTLITDVQAYIQGLVGTELPNPINLP